MITCSITFDENFFVLAYFVSKSHRKNTPLHFQFNMVKLLNNYSPFLSKNFSNIDRKWAQFPGLAFTFQFEEYLLDNLGAIRDYVSYHYLLPIVLSAIYCITIFQLGHWMTPRQPFRLRLPLLIWNTTLAIFSIFGCVRVLPELFWMLKHRGLFASTCDHRFIDDARVFLWIYLFTFSKVWEFGDTMFILFRKQNLLTLHWVHHAWTLVYCWYSMFELPAHSRWLCSMNFAVHSIMYSYYAVMASGIRVPKAMAQVVTLLQIAQMTFGLYTQGQALWLTQVGCDVPRPMATFGFLMYLTFWALFIKFFFDKYLVNSRRPTSKYSKD